MMTTRFTLALRNRRRDNDEHEGDPDMSDPIPLSALVLEGLGEGLHGPPSVETLEQRIRDAGHPVIIDYIGRRCVSRDVAKILLTEHHDQLEAQRQAAEEARLEATRRGNPIVARAEALNAKHARMRAAGVLDPGTSPLAVMRLGEHDERLDAASARMDEFLSIAPGDYGTMHRYTPKG
jgi:hypothetical protein